VPLDPALIALRSGGIFLVLVSRGVRHSI